MLIRPNIKDEDISNNVASLNQISNELMIHDVSSFSLNTPNEASYTHGGYNDILAKATQVIDSVVIGFPRDTNVSDYMTAPTNRRSYVRYVYNYMVFMSSAYKELKDRISHGTFHLLNAVASGFTDAKPLPDYYTFDAEGSNKKVHPFSTTVFTSDQNLITTIGNPVSELSHVRLDIPKPTDFKVKEICETGVISLFSNDEPLRNSYMDWKVNNGVYHVLGESLVNGVDGGTKLTKFRIIENSMVDKDDEEYKRQIRSSLPGYDSNDPILGNLLKTLEIRLSIRNMIVDMIKTYYTSCFKEFTLVYRTDYKSGYRSAVSPINKMIDGFTVDNMNKMLNDFIRKCKILESKFDEPIDVIYHVNEIETICKVKLLKSKCEETKRMTNSDSLHDYILESIHSKDVNQFKHDMDLDTLDYYSYHDNDNYRVSHRGKQIC